MFADRLSDDIVQSVIDLLFKQLSLLVENIILSGVAESGSDVSVGQGKSEHAHELKQNEAALCYFLAFLRRVAVTKVAQTKLVSSPWLDLFMGIISFTSEEKEHSHFGLRTQMLTLHLLTFVLPACEDIVLIKTVSVNSS